MNRTTAIATGAWIVVMAAGLSALVIRALYPFPLVANTGGLGPASIVAGVVLGVAWATVGALLMARRPANVVGRWVLLVGFGYAASMLTLAAMSATVDHGQADVEVTRVFGWLTGLFSLLATGVFYLAVIFPTGRGHSPRWSIAGRIFLVFAIAAATTVLTQPGPLQLLPSFDNPFGFGFDLRPLFGERFTQVFILLAPLFAPLSFAALYARYRAAGPVERLQVRWFMSAVSLTVVTLAIGAVVWAGDTNGTVGEAPFIAYAVSSTAVPISIGIAILRYRLYEIDRIISRTVSYGAVTGILALVFVVTILVSQTVLASFFSGSSVAVAASTLVVAALFQPLRRRVQAVVDRRFNRSRYDAERTVAAFTGVLRNEVDLASLSGDIARVVDTTLHPIRIGVWLRAPRQDVSRRTTP